MAIPMPNSTCMPSDRLFPTGPPGCVSRVINDYNGSSSSAIRRRPSGQQTTYRTCIIQSGWAKARCL
jgi:hypothetical protein